MRGTFQGGPVFEVTSANRPVLIADQDHPWHLEWKRRTAVDHMAVGLCQVEPPVIVRVEQGDPEAQEKPAGRGQANYRGLVSVEALAHIFKEARRLSVKVGHEQIRQAIPVGIAECSPHAGLESPICIAGDARRRRYLFKRHVPLVVIVIVGRRVVRHEQVDRTVVVEVGGDDTQASPIRIHDSGLGRDVDKAAFVVAKQMVGLSRERIGHAVIVAPTGVDRLALLGLSLAKVRVLGIPDQVMADVEVEVSVVIEIGERG